MHAIFNCESVISQNEKSIVFHSRKLCSTQTRYIITERELLAIVEILRIELLIEEFNPELKYVRHKI